MAIMASVPITWWQIEGEKVEMVTDFISLGSKIRGQWLQSWNLKMLAPWKKSYDKPRQHIKRQRHHFAYNVHEWVLSSFSPVWLLAMPVSLLCPWDSLGRNIGVGCHALLQGIFPTQGSDSHPRTEMPGVPQSMQLQRVGDSIETEQQ